MKITSNFQVSSPIVYPLKVSFFSVICKILRKISLRLKLSIFQARFPGKMKEDGEVSAKTFNHPTNRSNQAIL